MTWLVHQGIFKSVRTFTSPQALLGDLDTAFLSRLIGAALVMINDNRASAAEMLGLSRQSFYVKLRRYGIGDLTASIPA